MPVNDLLIKQRMEEGMARFGPLAEAIRQEFEGFKEIPFIIVEGNASDLDLVRTFGMDDLDNPLPGHQTVAIHPTSEELDGQTLKSMVAASLFEAVTGMPPDKRAFPDQVNMERFRPPPMGKFQVEEGNLL